MKITDYLVQNNCKNEYGRCILHHPQYPVNMRLFKSSQEYRELILNIVKYMGRHLNSIFEDYTTPQGVSASTMGIPFNIIGYKDSGTNHFCINPRINAHRGGKIHTTSNCGSVRLKQPAPVVRSEIIDLEFYDLDGNKVILTGITKERGGFIIQHEIDHSLGIVVGGENNPEKKCWIGHNYVGKSSL